MSDLDAVEGDEPRTDAEQRRAWLHLIGATAATILASAYLAYLMWHHVPSELAAIVDLDLDLILPLVTRISIFLSNWFVRLGPLLVILAVPLAALWALLIALALVRSPPVWALKALTIGLLGLTIAEAGLAGFVVYAMQIGRDAASHQSDTKPGTPE